MRQTKFLMGRSDGKDFRLPVAFTTQTCAVLARKGAGKTYTSHVLAEGLLGNQQQVVVIDPLNAWWGLRSGNAGRTPMFEVVIFGGEYGDMPLERDMGSAVAKLVAENPALSCVLSLRHMRKGDQYKFVTDFSETLFHIKGESKYATPVHLFMDEADRFCPQRMWQGAERMVGAVEDIVLRGRQAGVGVTMITQRSARINKNVLTQVEMLVIGQITGPQDKKAIREWIELNADVEKQKEFLESLAKLKRGQLWFWSPAWLGCMKLVNVKEKLTFDSSATPKPGAKPKTPKKRAPVDLKEIRKVLADTVKKIEDNDPKRLKAEIARLQKEGAKKQPVTEVAKVDVEAIVSSAILEYEKRVKAAVVRARDRLKSDGIMSPRIEDVLGSMAKEMGPAMIDRSKTKAPPSVRTAPAGTKSTPAREDDSSDVSLSRCERAILKVLRMRDKPSSKKTVALQSGYSAKSGGFNNALSRLRKANMIQSNGNGLIETTRIGFHLGDSGDIEVVDIEYWKRHKSVGKCGAAILTVLQEHHGPMSKQEIAESTVPPYAPTSGGFNNALSKLRTLELIEGRGEITLSSELFD